MRGLGRLVVVVAAAIGRRVLTPPVRASARVRLAFFPATFVWRTQSVLLRYVGRRGSGLAGVEGWGTGTAIARGMLLRSADVAELLSIGRNVHKRPVPQQTTLKSAGRRYGGPRPWRGRTQRNGARSDGQLTPHGPWNASPNQAPAARWFWRPALRRASRPSSLGSQSPFPPRRPSRALVLTAVGGRTCRH